MVGALYMVRQTAGIYLNQTERECKMTYQIESLKTLAKKDLGETQRLARIIAKGGKVGTVETESLGCIVPILSRNTIEVIMHNDAAFEFVRNAVYGVQDSLIRKAVEQGKLCVFDSQIDIEAIVSAMNDVNESVRFSKESIKKWFDANLRQSLSEAIGKKLGASVASDKITKLVDGYLVQFQTLAGRNVSMDSKVKAQLLRALDFLPEEHDSETGAELVRRLNDAQEATEMLAAL